MKKIKIVSAILSAFLLTTPASALTLKDMILVNKTSGGAAKIDGTTYYSGGNFELRFKKNTYAFKPWFNGEPPRFHIGCNGISISGGFISLLGLDDIKEQLDNASTAFAWGMIMGIKASLPLVSEVFDTIQAWARMIQKLLQNACKAGQDLVRNHEPGKSINQWIDEHISSLSFKDAKESLDSGEEKKDKTKKYVEDAVNNHKPAAKDLTNKHLKAFVKGKTVSLATLYFGKYLPKPTSTDQVMWVGDLNEIYNDKKIGGLSLNIDNNDEFKRAVLFHQLALLCFGEIGISKADFEKLTKIIDDNGKINKDKLVGATLKAINGEENTKDESFNAVPLAATLDASNVYQFLINGVSALDTGSDDSACDDSGCKIRDYKAFYIYGETDNAVNAESNTNDGKDKDILRAFSLVQAEGNANIRLQWEGFYKKSLDLIRNKVKTEASLNSYSFLGRAPNDVSETEVNVILPGFNKYIRILGLLAKKQKGETNYIYYLEDLLAKRNAQAQAFLFVANLESFIETLMKDPTVTIGKDARQALNDYLKNVKKVQETMKENLLGNLKIDKSFQDMDMMFNLIDKSIKENNLKHVGF